MTKLDNSQWTVELLRQAGYKVRVNHYRFVKHRSEYDTVYSMNHGKSRIELLALFTIKALNLQDQIVSHGGLVDVEVLCPDGVEVVGRSECSAKDWYCNKIGVKIALSRALAEYEKLVAIKDLEKRVGDGTGT